MMFRAHYWQFSGTMLDAGHQTQLGLCKVSILPTAIAPAPAPHLENLSAILPAAGSWCPASVDWPAHCRISKHAEPCHPAGQREGSQGYSPPPLVEKEPLRKDNLQPALVPGSSKEAREHAGGPFLACVLVSPWHCPAQAEC